MSVCIGYNTSFDLGFLDRIGIPTEHLTVIDVMQMFVDYLNANGGTLADALRSLPVQNILITSGRVQHTTAFADAKATLYCYNMMKIIK